MVKVQRLFAKTNLKIPVYWKAAENEKSEVNEGEKSEKEASVCVNFRHY